MSRWLRKIRWWLRIYRWVLGQAVGWLSLWESPGKVTMDQWGENRSQSSLTLGGQNKSQRIRYRRESLMLTRLYLSSKKKERNNLNRLCQSSPTSMAPSSTNNDCEFVIVHNIYFCIHFQSLNKDISSIKLDKSSAHLVVLISNKLILHKYRRIFEFYIQSVLLKLYYKSL